MMGGQLTFAEAFLAEKAGQNRRLARIAMLIDWSAFTPLLRQVPTSRAGRPPYPATAMSKALLLAQWYQLSDPALEEALADRISFRRFCGFALDEVTPDETTICRFRRALAEAGRGRQLSARLGPPPPAAGAFLKE